MFRPHKVFSLVALSLGLLLTPAITHAQSKTQQDPKIKFISSGITNARSKIRSFQASTEYYNFEPKEVNAIFADLFPDSKLKLNVDIENIWSTQYWSQGDLHKSSITYLKGDMQSENHTRIIFIEPLQAATLDWDLVKKEDGTEEKRYVVGSIVPREWGFRDGFSGDIQGSDPRKLAHPAGLNLFFDDLLNRADVPAFYKGEVELDGTLCYKIERHSDANNQKIYWLDKEHDFIVRRIEYMEKVGDKWFPTQVTRTLRIQESNGIWFPALVEMRVAFALMPPYQVGGEKYGKLPVGVAPDKVQTVNGILTVPGRFYRYTVENLRVNKPIAPENLVLEWPPNSIVFNRITGKPVDTTPKPPKETPEKTAP